jgi:hypothetical protein
LAVAVRISSTVVVATIVSKAVVATILILSRRQLLPK